ncbi:putative acetyltransferase [Actinacidiphila reveromycinica]|uniref:Putative acetyltransferase n=1 Tax=Actinacidiphila reveromycinica TaxID=659352 RepID=A0A7U3VMR8_9ACTN|nr:GNAT family N-acetyltransferase [Streptomyces sp. SN-593]BBA96864.1 putative acetyltransferase [Streptomyces sp. SN-593]
MPTKHRRLTAPTADDVRAWHRVRSAALAHDRPGEPLPTLADVRTALTTVGPGSRLALWLVHGANGEGVATAKLRLPAAEGGGRLASVQLTVHPAHRRMGTGSRLLATVVAAAAEEDCRRLSTEVLAGTPGESFLATRDFVPALRLTWQRLLLAETPERIVKLPDVPHPGYRLAAWEGTPPDALAESFAAARAGLAALPTGSLGVTRAGWDAERVRRSAELAARRGERLLNHAAVSVADGSVAGYTKLTLPAEVETGARAKQLDTAVVPAHRGHGLGLWLKSAMLRHLRDAHPEVTEVVTNTADDNRHMLAVNAALGFRPLRRTVAYQLRLT